MEKNKKNTKKNGTKGSKIYTVAAILLVGILIYSGFRALQIFIPQYQASKKFEGLKKQAGISDINVDDIIEANNKKDSDESNGDRNNNKTDTGKTDKGLAELYKMNNDFVGWLTIEDTIIDYPVMKSSEDNPEFYLHHDFEKEESGSGTLFIGEGCDDLSDIFVVYGHNMNADTMFGTLDDYSDAAFTEEHKDIIFRTPTENRVYRVFAVFQTKIYTQPTEAFEYYKNVGKLGGKEYDNAVENYRNMSMISLNDAPKYPQQIMLLSTCSYHTSEGRFVVAAYRIA